MLGSNIGNLLDQQGINEYAQLVGVMTDAILSFEVTKRQSRLEQEISRSG